MGKKEKNIRVFLIQLAIFTASLIVSLFLAELIFRVFDLPPYEPTPQPIKDMYQADDELGFTLRPGWEGVLADLEFKTTIKANADGIRDVEHQPDSKKKKILIVGDSFAFGQSVDFKETFGAVLENKLPKMEVIKAGISSYGANQALLLAKRMTQRYHPEILLFTFYEGNDFGDDINFPHFNTVKDGYLILWDQREEPVEELISRDNDQTNDLLIGEAKILGKSRLYRFLRFKAIQLGWIENPFMSKLVETPQGDGIKTERLCWWPIYMQYITPGFPKDSKTGQKQWRSTQEVFLELKAFTDANNMKLIVLIIPDKIQASDKIWHFLTSKCTNFKNEEEYDRFGATQLLKDFFLQNRIEYIDFLSVFRAEKRPEALYFNKDPHLTNLGHELVAKTIYNYFLIRGMI
jgi:hypothetical protein